MSDITYIALGQRLRLPCGADGCLHALHPRLLPVPQPRRGLDADGTEKSARRQRARDTPLRPGRTVHASVNAYAATKYVSLLQSKGVLVSMAACSHKCERVGCPEENGFAERLMRTIKEEHVHTCVKPSVSRSTTTFRTPRANWAIPRRRISAQASPLVARLPHPCRVRGASQRTKRIGVRRAISADGYLA